MAFPTIHIRGVTSSEQSAVFNRKFSEAVKELGLDVAELRITYARD
jgi:hypothetical protein